MASNSANDDVLTVEEKNLKSMKITTLGSKRNLIFEYIF